MKRYNTVKRCSAILLWWLVSLLPLSLYANWSTTPDSAVFVSTAWADGKALVPDGHRGVYVVLWKPPTYMTWAEHFDSTGTKTWPQWIQFQGQAGHETWLLASAPTQDNCVLVVFLDVQWTYPFEKGRGELHLQKIDIAGNLLWGGQGIVVSTPDLSGPPDLDQVHTIRALVTSTIEYGAIIAWSDFRDSDPFIAHPHLYTQKVSPDGEILWQEGGVHITGGASQLNFMETRENGDVVLVHASPQKIQILHPDGTMMYSEGGINTPSTDGFGLYFQVNPLNEMFYLWRHHAFKMNSEFEFLWPDTGIAMSYNTGFIKGTAADDSGGYCVYVEDTRAGIPGMYAQYIDSGGNILFGDSSLWVFPELGTYATSIKSENSTFIFTQQHDDRQYAKRIDRWGNLVWDGEVLICSLGDHLPYGRPVATTDGAGGLIYLFDDRTNMWLSKVDSTGNLGTYITVAQEVNKPECFYLSAYPNPFNPTTTIRYTIPKNDLVSLTIYDQLGREVKTLVNQQQSIGEHQVLWDGRDDIGHTLSSGVYLCQMKAGGISQNIKLVFLK